MAYGRSMEEARRRVVVKRQLRSLGETDFKNDDPLGDLRKKLKAKKTRLF